MRAGQASVQHAGGIKADLPHRPSLALHLNEGQKGGVVILGHRFVVAQSSGEAIQARSKVTALPKIERALDRTAHAVDLLGKLLHGIFGKIISPLQSALVLKEIVAAESAQAVHLRGKPLKALAQGVLLGEKPPDANKLLVLQRCGIHRAGAVAKVVCLVDQERVASKILGVSVEEAAQVNVGIKDVVVVADHHVAKLGQHELKLVRADAHLLRKLQDRRARKAVLPVKGKPYCLLCAVKEALREGTVHGIAVSRDACGILLGLLVAAELLA